MLAELRRYFLNLVTVCAAWSAIPTVKEEDTGRKGFGCEHPRRAFSSFR
jgi:hypothetical protein